MTFFEILSGHIISAGVTSLVLFGKMNVSEAHLNQDERDVLGSQVIIFIQTPSV